MIKIKNKIYNITPDFMKVILANVRSDYRSYPSPIRRLASFFTFKEMYPKELSKEKKFILIGTPHFGNLGDQAIAKAQVDFLTQNFPNRKIIEIQIHEIESKLYSLHKVVTKDDVIFFQGGGNIGDIYVTEENIRRKVLRYFRDVPTIQFPQSLTYKDLSHSNYNLRLSEKIYSGRANDFIISTRESKSYNLSCKIFRNNKILYTPDIVLSLPRVNSNNKRNGVLFCMRKDSEKILDIREENELISKIKDKYKKIEIADTEVPYFIYKNERNLELEKIWNKYMSSRIVVTDRLHGMIFAVITGTPCIVFDNFNSKIKMTYLDWLSDYKNIRFINQNNKFDINSIMDEIEEIIDKDVPEFSVEDKYSPLIETINKLI